MARGKQIDYCYYYHIIIIYLLFCYYDQVNNDDDLFFSKVSEKNQRICKVRSRNLKHHERLSKIPSWHHTNPSRHSFTLYMNLLSPTHPHQFSKIHPYNDTSPTTK